MDTSNGSPKIRDLCRCHVHGLVALLTRQADQDQTCPGLYLPKRMHYFPEPPDDLPPEVSSICPGTLTNTGTNMSGSRCFILGTGGTGINNQTPRPTHFCPDTIWISILSTLWVPVWGLRGSACLHGMPFIRLGLQNIAIRILLQAGPVIVECFYLGQDNIRDPEIPTKS